MANETVLRTARSKWARFREQNLWVQQLHRKTTRKPKNITAIIQYNELRRLVLDGIFPSKDEFCQHIASGDFVTNKSNPSRKPQEANPNKIFYVGLVWYGGVGYPTKKTLKKSNLGGFKKALRARLKKLDAKGKLPPISTEQQHVDFYSHV